MEKFLPGEIVPKSCTYIIYDKSNNNIGTLKLQKCERFPSTQHFGSYYTAEQKK